MSKIKGMGQINVTVRIFPYKCVEAWIGLPLGPKSIAAGKSAVVTIPKELNSNASQPIRPSSFQRMAHAGIVSNSNLVS